MNLSMEFFRKQLEICFERTCGTRHYVMHFNQNSALELITINDLDPKPQFP